MYLVQSILLGADETNEADYSEPLVLSTVDAFGDVVGPVAGPSGASIESDSRRSD